MFELEELERAVDELDPPLTADSVTRLFAIIDRLQAKGTVVAGAYERTQDWAAEGAASYTAWLRAHARRSGGEAHRIVTNGRRMRSLPVLAQSWLQGRLATGQVNAVLMNVSDQTLQLFAEFEAELVPTLE